MHIGRQSMDEILAHKKNGENQSVSVLCNAQSVQTKT